MEIPALLNTKYKLIVKGPLFALFSIEKSREELVGRNFKGVLNRSWIFYLGFRISSISFAPNPNFIYWFSFKWQFSSWSRNVLLFLVKVVDPSWWFCYQLLLFSVHSLQEYHLGLQHWTPDFKKRCHNDYRKIDWSYYQRIDINEKANLQKQYKHSNYLKWMRILNLFK